jgi:hypothetical protein
LEQQRKKTAEYEFWIQGARGLEADRRSAEEKATLEALLKRVHEQVARIHHCQRLLNQPLMTQEEYLARTVDQLRERADTLEQQLRTMAPTVAPDQKPE